MKQLISILVLVGISAGCQPQAASIAASRSKVPALAASDYPAVADSLTPAARGLLRRHSLAAQLQAKSSATDTLPQPLNGFFGRSPDRLEVVFTQVQPEAARPNVFRVQGKSRYQKAITPFAGQITLTRLTKPRIRVYVVDPKSGKERLSGDTLRKYTAVGSFELRETTAGPEAGIFRGTVALDFAIGNDSLITTEVPEATPGRLKYEGNWISKVTGRAQPVVWVASLFTYARFQPFDDFLLGGRSMGINPKYKKYGWDNFWQNDEWWADPPKPKLSL